MYVLNKYWAVRGKKKIQKKKEKEEQDIVEWSGCASNHCLLFAVEKKDFIF